MNTKRLRILGGRNPNRLIPFEHVGNKKGLVKSMKYYLPLLSVFNCLCKTMFIRLDTIFCRNNLNYHTRSGWVVVQVIMRRCLNFHTQTKQGIPITSNVHCVREEFILKPFELFLSDGNPAVVNATYPDSFLNFHLLS